MAHESSCVPSPLPSPDHKSSSKGNKNHNDLILDTHVSFNPPPSPTPTPSRTRKSVNPERLVLDSEGMSSHNPSHEGDDPTLPNNLNETPSPIAQDEDGVVQPNGHRTTETREVDVDLAIVLEKSENKDEIIEGFMMALATRSNESGERTPLAEKKVSNTLGEKDPPIHESGEKSLQEEPLVTDPPKWYGTPTPYVPATVVSLAPEDDEESCQNTIKRSRLTRAMVLYDEALSTQLVELDTINPPQVVEDNPEARQESHYSSKARAKGKKLAILEEPSEEPGDARTSRDGEIPWLGIVVRTSYSNNYESEVYDFYFFLMFTDEKLEGILKSDKMFKKQLKPEYQLLFRISEQGRLPRASIALLLLAGTVFIIGLNNVSTFESSSSHD
ncbi:hypothetical protein HAX54_007715 [Datura stramonium]|uniref:Uncharacterized protein n=1 Tax=Datura stramonium TaxID=4076 RepID=A0ABS8TD37_DATST|nr:hypothetical protein [Datura stramonium]